MADRRGSGALARAVARLLAHSPTALTGIAIAERLRRDDPGISNSLVFRSLSQLRRDGAVRKIEHVNGYAWGGDTRMVSLVCMTCGALAQRDAPGLFEALDALAGQHGFRPDRYVIEVAGACRACGGAGD